MNKASREALVTIPFLTDQVATSIVENQPFLSIPHFRREIGKLVPPDRVAAYERSLYVPVTPNGADTETLRQLPGVDVPIAGQLARARPYTSVDAFLEKLGELVSPDQLEAARAYIEQS